MKSIKEWLKEYLKEDEFARAKRYEDEHWRKEIENPKRALTQAFVWSNTDEGHMYWQDVRFRIGEMWEYETTNRMLEDGV